MFARDCRLELLELLVFGALRAQGPQVVCEILLPLPLLRLLLLAGQSLVEGLRSGCVQLLLNFGVGRQPSLHLVRFVAPHNFISDFVQVLLYHDAPIFAGVEHSGRV